MCDLSNGYEAEPAAFLQEADACLEGVDGITPKTYLESQLRDLANTARDDAYLEELKPLSSLNEAARLHAFDMAARDYVSHDDKEGRTHLDRIRMIDRSALLGAFGANLVVVDASTGAAEAQAALAADAESADNFVRTSFDHMGVGAVESDGKIYIVELFARLEGKLNAPLPSDVTERASLSAQFAEAGAEIKSWTLVSHDGETLARGRGDRLSATLPGNETGYLLLDLAVSGSTYAVKGPAAQYN